MTLSTGDVSEADGRPGETEEKEWHSMARLNCKLKTKQKTQIMTETKCRS